MDTKKVNVAVIGLGFGSEFVPIYQKHPNAGKIAICTRNPKTLNDVGERFGIEKDLRFSNYYDIVDRDDIDAIHIVTPIGEHTEQTLASLESGKHTACTVPMATSIEDCESIIDAKKKSKKVYMMMETALYTREFLYVKEMQQKGELGRIQFMRGAHMQNMALEGWGNYWLGFPPFYYGTHALSPILYLSGTQAETVVCHGSGELSKDKAEKYGSSFAVETATFTLKNSNIVIEATRCLFETVRQVVESFCVYGDKKSFEWEQILDEGPVIFENIDDARRIVVPENGHLLPDEIASFTQRESVYDKNQPSFIQGSGHGGSHPHLVHEFLRAIVEERESEVDAIQSAQYTCAGISAHESAMNNGTRIRVPNFT